MKHKVVLWTLLFAFIPMYAHGQANSINLWHSYTAGERQALELVIKRFQSKHPNLQVEASFVPFNALADKLTAARYKIEMMTSATRRERYPLCCPCCAAAPGAQTLWADKSGRPQQPAGRAARIAAEPETESRT